MQERRQHEWERLDQGIAYCRRCPNTSASADKECMSANPRTLIKTEEPQIRIVSPQPKPVDNVKVELQKVRRELLTLASRVEKLAQSQETA